MVSDKTRREAFITQNLGLVHACAGRFRGRGIEYDDLYGAGCMGLVKACDNFDPERGVCFSTYAVPVILGEIKKLFREGGTVKVSRSLKELGMRVQAAREHTMKLCGTEPTLSQLAEQLGESVENVAMAIQAAQPAMSLTPEGREDAEHQLDIPVESPEEALADRISLEEVLRALPEQDRQLIQLRFYGNRTQSGSLFAQHTDYIFSSMGEELGFVGCLAIMIMEMAIIARCIYVGMHCQDYMRRLVCYGAASALMFQVMINTGMCIGVMPVIGLTLPLISYGGSSVVSIYAMLGLVSGAHARPQSLSHERYVQPYR